MRLVIILCNIVIFDHVHANYQNVTQNAYKSMLSIIKTEMFPNHRLYTNIDVYDIVDRFLKSEKSSE